MFLAKGDFFRRGRLLCSFNNVTSSRGASRNLIILKRSLDFIVKMGFTCQQPVVNFTLSSLPPEVLMHSLDTFATLCKIIEDVLFFCRKVTKSVPKSPYVAKRIFTHFSASYMVWICTVVSGGKFPVW